MAGATIQRPQASRGLAIGEAQGSRIATRGLLTVGRQCSAGFVRGLHARVSLLASLASRSLVQIQASPVIRYSLLETVRQFAASRLAASGEETPVHVRLLRWALEVARSAEAARPGAERSGWSDRLSAEQASLRAALSWALGGHEPKRGGSSPPGSPGGGSPPAATAKQASSWPWRPVSRTWRIPASRPG